MLDTQPNKTSYEPITSKDSTSKPEATKPEGRSIWNFLRRRGKDATLTAISDLVGDSNELQINVTDDKLEFIAKNDAIGYRASYGLASDAVDNWNTITDLEGNANEALDNQAQIFAEENNLKQVMIDFIGTSRWSKRVVFVDWLAMGFDPGRRFEVFGETSFTVNWDSQTGVPLSFQVKVPIGDNVRDILVPAEFVIFFRNIKDIAPLKPAYYDISIHRNLGYSIGQTFYRFGTGFPVIKVPDDGFKDAAAETAFETVFRTINRQESFVLDEGFELEFKGAQGSALNPQQYVEAIWDRISAVTRIPKIILKGAEAGALASSKTNQTQYWSLLGSIQTEWRWVFEQIYVRGGLPADNTWKVMFNFPDADPRETAEIELLKANTNNAKLGIMTKDEVRADDGLDPLPEEESETDPFEDDPDADEENQDDPEDEETSTEPPEEDEDEETSEDE